jgi:hypothetical protein
MTTSIELLAEFKQGVKVYSPQYVDELLGPVEARINNERAVMNQLASALALMPCGCRREYPYHGKGVSMCVRCRALVLWETLEKGDSEIQKHFDKVIPK